MIRTPASILYDVNGIATAVSASDQPTSGALGHVMAGFDATNSVRYATFDTDSLKVTGTLAINDGGGSITVDGSVTAFGDNGIALQQDAANKLIVIDTDVSGAINDTRVTLSGSLADFADRNRTDLLLVSGAVNDTRLTLSSSIQDFKDANHTDLLLVSGAIESARISLSGSIDDARLTLSSSIADFSNRNRTDLLLVSGAIESSRISLSGSIDDVRLTLSSSIREFKDANHADLLLVSGAVNDTRITLSGSLTDFADRNRTDLLLVSGAVNDARLTLSSSIREFKDSNHTDLLLVSGAIASSELVISGALAQIYTELNSGDVDIRALTFSTDSVTAYQGGIWSVTGSGDAGVLRQDPSTRDLYVTGSVLVTSGAIAITDNVNGLANIETIGTRKALAVEYPLLLDTMSQILIELKRIRKHMESITEEEWSENDDI